MKPLLWIVAVLLLLGAGYFTYDRLAKNKSIDTWSFMPESAALVYSSGSSLDAFESLRGTVLWNTLVQMGGFEQLNSRFEYLDGLTNQQFQRLFASGEFLVGVQDVSRNQFDFLYILEIKSINAFQQLQTIQNHFEEQGLLKKNRQYQDFTITEISDGFETLTFIFHKNFLVASFSAFLVEDAIRTLKDNSKSNFRERFPELQSIAKLEEDAGDLYINYENVGRLIKVFTKEMDIEFERSGYMDIRVNDNSLEFTGFTIPSSSKTSLLKPHMGLSPGTLDIPSIVPLQSSLMIHYSFADPIQWKQNLEEHLKLTDQQAIADRKILLNTGDFDVNTVFDYLDDEMALLHFAGISELRKALILEVSDAPKAMTFFGDLAQRFGRTQGKSQYTEQYEGYQIVLLPASDFPKAMIGSMASGFRNCYFTRINNNLVFASELFLLKEIIQAVNNENVWSKSLQKNQFLEQTNQASNVSVFVNTPDFWQELSGNINDHWQSYLRENTPFLKSLDNVAIQFSNVDNRFFTNIVIAQTEPPSVGTREVNTLRTLALTDNIITKPFLVRNHINNGQEIFLQDSALNAYLIDDQFNVLWTAPLAGPIKGDIFQLDYYRNGKLQLAFVAGNSLYVIDRNGSLLPGFPQAVKGLAEIQHFNLIDYDGSRNYRFSFADDRGNLMLTDKNGKPLEGWNPKKIGSALIRPLSHYRIGNRDVISAVSKEGEVHLFNRRGQYENNFPLDLQVPISNHFHLDVGADLANSELTVVNEIGEIISLNLQGQITRKEQLYKRSPEMKYDILEDISKNYFLLTTQNNETWTLMDDGGAELFQKEYLANTELTEQFYRISAGKELILIGSHNEGKAYAFDLEGQLLTNAPIGATRPFSMIYSSREDAYQLYTIDGNSLKLIQLAAR